MVVLHEGVKETTKVWRFDPGKEYMKEGEVRELFPHLSKKGLHHIDELAGRIDIESDGDLKEALDNFEDECVV